MRYANWEWTGTKICAHGGGSQPRRHGGLRLRSTQPYGWCCESVSAPQRPAPQSGSVQVTKLNTLYTRESSVSAPQGSAPQSVCRLPPLHLTYIRRLPAPVPRWHCYFAFVCTTIYIHELLCTIGTLALKFR